MDILVTGLPRSATTWVANVLAAGTGAHLWHEPDNAHAHPYAMAAKRSLGRFPLLEPTDEAAGLQQIWDGVRDRRASARRRGRVARRIHARLWQSAEIEVGPRPTSTAIALRAVERLSEPPSSPEATNVVAKTVLSSLCLGWLRRVWPGPIVLAQRSPMAVVASWHALGWHPPFERSPLLGDKRRDDTLEQLRRRTPVPEPPASGLARLAWDLGVLAAVQQADAAALDMVVVNHEVLMQSPVERFRALFATLGVPLEPAGLGYIANHDAVSSSADPAFDVTRRAADEAGKWRSIFCASEQREVKAVLRDFPALAESCELALPTT